MGVIYSAIPLDDEIRNWLEAEGVEVPDRNGKRLTPNQVARILRSIKDVKVEFNVKPEVWQAEVSALKSADQWTMLNVLDYTAPNQPCRICFEKGSPHLIIKIVHNLPRFGGPIAVIPDSGCPAAIVEESSDVNQIIQTWPHISG